MEYPVPNPPQHSSSLLGTTLRALLTQAYPALNREQVLRLRGHSAAAPGRGSFSRGLGVMESLAGWWWPACRQSQCLAVLRRRCGGETCATGVFDITSGDLLAGL